ncbi:TolC family protein [Salinispirillum sp. LH 10-3-1]|uniref:TolC family protein n=1 Tax=Salinispirillum sp. LH 10-3-1 TaxID=2952525 RepID=A0AB38YFI2_9GAMM
MMFNVEPGRTIGCHAAAVGLLLAAVPSVTLAENTLSMPEYLRQALHSHVRVRQHQAGMPAQDMALRDARQRYVPELTVRSSWDESETARVENPAPAPDTPFQAKRGTTLGLDSTWALPFGTEIQLSTEQQYGQQTGLTASGIPDDYQHIQQYSVEVTQPLLRHWTPQYNRLPVLQARATFANYENEGVLTQWEVLQDSLNRLIELQAQYDRLAVHQALLEGYEFLRDTAAAQRLEGRATELDLTMAELALARQDNQLRREEQVYQERQDELSRSLLLATSLRVEPLSELSVLSRWLHQQVAQENTQSARMPPVQPTHPELRQAALQREQADYGWRQVRRQHWPDIEAYYRYQHDIRELLPDAETQSWGLRVSYTVNDLPTRTSRLRAQGQLLSAQWQLDDTQDRLQAEAARLWAEWNHLERERELLMQSIRLHEVALAQQWQRLEMGFASVREIQQQQRNLLDAQLERIDAEAQRARTLVRLHYVRNTDVLALLSNHP